MFYPSLLMAYPLFDIQISDEEIQHMDVIWNEMCGQMANLVGDSGCNKGQLTDLVNAICRDFPTTYIYYLTIFASPLNASITWTIGQCLNFSFLQR